ncbi:NADPH-dependent FMN reductase [Streptomyces fuscigenes]|uniref:NADPH-dependent FMN reductase n=1 Tax=Streptomyces fuscigenes TaxID=1528880 RepID=UPI001F1BA1D9|nr:NADPH-dependent FMN reductase [Streptomyces fuscigenes]MCF3960144.1 NADPH-dependent FMN reductase [Streptomyces fuscigenes]
MATVLSLSGSPSASSRTAGLLRHLGARVAEQGHHVVPLDVRTLPAEPLLHGDTAAPDILRAVELVQSADGVVVGTPVYKAAYSGLLKSLLDLLPQTALAGKTVLPLATGGTAAHALAIDYALRPVLSSMGAPHIVQGWFVLDRHISLDGGRVRVDPGAEEGLHKVVDRFTGALASRSALAGAR